MGMTDQLELISERPQTITLLPTVNGFAAEVVTEGMMLRQVLTLRTGESTWQAYESCRYPDGQWSQLTRLPAFRYHPTPSDGPGLIAFARWLYAPIRELSS